MDRVNNALSRYAPLLIRIALGAVFIVHGWDKLLDIPGQTEFFADVGVPYPPITIWVVTFMEFAGGLLVLAGWYTRAGATALVLVMIGAMITFKFSVGFIDGWEFDLVLCLMAISLLLSGPGYPSVDAIQSLDLIADE